jgi:hypothetical protein
MATQKIKHLATADSKRGFILLLFHVQRKGRRKKTSLMDEIAI